MGWNGRMDFPEYYGAQYTRDRVSSIDDTTLNIMAEHRAETEAECAHENSVPNGDDFAECLDCGRLFEPGASAQKRVA